MPHLRKILLIVLLVLHTSLAKAGFMQAVEAYQKQDYQTAFRLFKQQAEIGEVRSQLNLGIMYFYGQGVEKDVNKAYAWVKIGTENDVENLDAKKQFAVISDQVADFDLAENEYEKLKPLYSFDALFKNIYPLLEDDENDSENQELVALEIKRPKFPKKAAISGIGGWVTAEFNLDPLGKPRDIRIIRENPKGYFVSETIKAIKKWRFEPMLDKNGQAIWYRGARYTLSFTFKDKVKYNDRMIKYYLSKAIKGDPEAQTNYAFFKENIREYEFKDADNATAWYFKAAKQGVPYAQYGLGRNLVKGNGCKQDMEKGIQWLTRAAANGVEEASEVLAEIAVQKPSKEAQQKAVSLIQSNHKLSPRNAIQFAWLFATSPYKDLRDPERAVELIEDLGWKKYNDGITKNEILAAAYAAKGNFKKAIRYQEDALDEAQEGGYYSKEIEAHLADYKQGKTWF